MGNQFPSQGNIQKQIDDIDAYIAAQEFEGEPVEDNILNNKHFDSGYISPSGFRLSKEHIFSTALLVDYIRQFRSQHSIPAYPILFEMLKLILGDIDPTNAVMFTQNLQPRIPPFLINSPLLKVFQSILTRNQIHSTHIVSRLQTEFVITDSIGHGAWGTVIRVIHNLDNTEYAIKKINICPNENGDSLLREVRLLAKLGHENINRYHTAWLDFELKAANTNEFVQRKNEYSSRESAEISHETGNDPFGNRNIGNIQIVDNQIVFADNDQDYPKVFSKSALSDSIVFQGQDQTGIRESTKGSSQNGFSQELTSNGNNSIRVLQEETPYTSFNSSPIREYPLAVNSNRFPSNKCHALIRHHSFPFANFRCRNKPYIPMSQDTNIIAKKETEEQELISVLCIQLELCEINLGEWLLERNNRCRTIDQLTTKDIYYAKNFTLQFFKGLNYLHSQGCIHRDIKPTNILLTKSLVLKICDFGLSKDTFRNGTIDKGTDHTSHIGTRKYASPEQLRGGDYTTQTDIYSSALVLAELFHPFTTECEKVDTFMKVKENNVPVQLVLKFPFESKLILQMVNENWEERPTAFKILTTLLESVPTEDNLLELVKLFKSKLSTYESI